MVRALQGEYARRDLGTAAERPRDDRRRPCLHGHRRDSTIPLLQGEGQRNQAV